LFMIPLRRFLIEREHGKLPFPEGTACAEVLVATEAGGGQARNVFLGLGAGALFKAVFGWAKLFPEVVKFPLLLIPKAQLGLKMSPALFGVGYILGPRIGAIMVGGGLLSSVVIIPLIGWWGIGRAEPLYPELQLTISEMEAGDIWEKYVRYIGAGAVATAGIITLIRSVPMMLESFRVGARQLADRFEGRTQKILRTGHDLPLSIVGVGAGAILLVMTFVPQVFGELGGELGGVPAHFVAAICVIVFAFFFVTVASRIVGLVGVTSNPTSGMTIAALIGTSGVFLLMGWTDASGKASALCVGCVVAIAASISGDTSQDLKTGFLLGATPRRQQIGELIGVMTASIFVCMTVIMLGEQPDAGFGSESLPAPQATLMKLVIDGILEQKLPWALIGIGAGIAVVVEVLRLPSLPFAVGVYLPVTTMVPVFLGGLLRYVLQKRAASKEESDSRREKGVLFGSGLVGGEGLLGVGIAGAAFYYKKSPKGLGSDWASDLARSIGASPDLASAAPSVLALAVFAFLIWTFARCSKSHG
ncbi:MAG: oligopeptide transporter, OPT family, partial [Planctomycetota bacterium]|nr:oligopeptide transporter, OPT family [Planctomycetota bacterium]